jgi:hypothetical protein
MRFAGQTDPSNPVTDIERLLRLRRSGALDEARVAAEITNVLAHSSSAGGSMGPALDCIMEQSAALELPQGMTTSRPERWACIEALLDVASAHDHPS